MLYDIFLNTLWVCGAVVAAIATLWFVFTVLRIMARTVLKGLRRPERETDSYSQGVVEPLAAPVKVPVASEVKHAPVFMPVVPKIESEAVECGNCHRDILSDSIEKKFENGIEQLVFECEHCGSRVAIAA